MFRKETHQARNSLNLAVVFARALQMGRAVKCLVRRRAAGSPLHDWTTVEDDHSVHQWHRVEKL